MLILQSERRQFMRQSENNMDVSCWQKFALARCEPAIPRIRLTLGTVPVSAGIK